jgi:hypothetical protein
VIILPTYEDKDCRDLEQRVEELEQDKETYSQELIKKLQALEDSNIAARRLQEDLMYNLDSDNVPYIHVMKRFKRDQTEANYEFNVSLDGISANMETLLEFKQTIENAGYVSMSDVKLEFNAELTAQSGSFYQSLTGQFYTKGDYVGGGTANTVITNIISQEVTQSGGSINSYLAGNFYTQTESDGKYLTSSSEWVTNISQTVNLQGAQIGLVVSGSTAQNSYINAASIVASINGSGSSVMISADHVDLSGIDISLAGKTINLTSDNITISSNNFNVDIYGNVTMNNANVTGTVNATSGRITGKLYIGQGSNFFLDGTAGANPVIQYGDTTSSYYFMVDSAGHVTSDGAQFNAVNVNTLQFTSPPGTTAQLYGYIQPTTIGGLNYLQWNSFRHISIQSRDSNGGGYIDIGNQVGTAAATDQIRVGYYNNSFGILQIISSANTGDISASTFYVRAYLINLNGVTIDSAGNMSVAGNLTVNGSGGGGGGGGGGSWNGGTVANQANFNGGVITTISSSIGWMIQDNINVYVSAFMSSGGEGFYFNFQSPIYRISMPAQNISMGYNGTSNGNPATIQMSGNISVGTYESNVYVLGDSTGSLISIVRNGGYYTVNISSSMTWYYNGNLLNLTKLYA